MKITEAMFRAHGYMAMVRDACIDVKHLTSPEGRRCTTPLQRRGMILEAVREARYTRTVFATDKEARRDDPVAWDAMNRYVDTVERLAEGGGYLD